MSKKVYELKQSAKSHVEANGFGNVTLSTQPTEEFEVDAGKGDTAVGSNPRGQWSRGLEFLFSCISMSVGLGNVWRFPHAAYSNGGGAFLIPYLLLLFVIGRPLYYMEMILGQFSGRGPIKVWKCVPALKGKFWQTNKCIRIGFAQLASTAYLIIFYNYLMALTLYYLFASFQSPLPWTVCDDRCTSLRNQTYNETNDANIDGHNSTLSNNENNSQIISLSEQYWKNNVLRLSSGLNEITWINWKLTLCLVLSWFLVYLSISRGVQSLGKVVYFTALFPYVVLFSLLVVALLSDGSINGIAYFFEPKWQKLLDPIVWYKAVEQSFFSLGVCFGTLTMYSSYNEFRNNVYRDAIIISVLDTFTSVLAGCVIFSVLGSMAFQMGVPIEEVVKEQGLGLAFIVYPQALSTFKYVPQLWSILFFVMLFTLGIGSSVAQMETILTAVKDEFTSLMKHKSLLAFLMCAFFCICGIPLTTNAGFYMMQLLDNYGVGTAIFLYGIFQLIGIMWIYGLNRFCNDIKFMLKRPVGIFWKVTWAFAAPFTLTVIFIYGNYQIIQKKDKDVENRGIPDWGLAIGWALAAIALLQIPVWALITIFRKRGSFKERVKSAFRATADWGPLDAVIHQQWLRFNGRHTQPKPATYQINPAFIPEF